MKKSIILILVSLFLFPVTINAKEWDNYSERKHYRQSHSSWGGYKGEGYYDYWYNPDRKRARREANKWPSGQHLQEPMGNYPTKGYFGGYKFYSDGSEEHWGYSTEE